MNGAKSVRCNDLESRSKAGVRFIVQWRKSFRSKNQCYMSDISERFLIEEEENCVQVGRESKKLLTITTMKMIGLFRQRNDNENRSNSSDTILFYFRIRLRMIG